jgi:phosphatidate cytidylyltransferase
MSTAHLRREAVRSIYGRLLLAALALPLLFAVVFWLTEPAFLAFHLFCIAGSLIGAIEVRSLLAHRGIGTFGISAAVLGSTLPALSYLQGVGVASEAWLAFWLAAVTGLLMLRSILMNNENDLRALLGRLAASLLVALYPAFFVYFIARLTSLQAASWKLALFFAMIFANDSAAYGVGKLFGRSLRLVISPNKSMIGFVAGFSASVATAIVIVRAVPRAFSYGAGGAAVIGAAVGVSTILGDLVESGMKRSAAVKDSGTLMMGRGGFLDSIDSMMLSAPLCFGLLLWLG